MAKALIDKIDDDRKEKIKRDLELCPGGDIRIDGNIWVRSAYRDSRLKRVPRENQVREAIKKVVSKKKLRFILSCDWILFFVLFVFFGVCSSKPVRLWQG